MKAVRCVDTDVVYASYDDTVNVPTDVEKDGGGIPS